MQPLQSSTGAIANSINVFVRVKPLSDGEYGLDKNHQWQIINENKAIMHTFTREMFTFGNLYVFKMFRSRLFGYDVNLGDFRYRMQEVGPLCHGRLQRDNLHIWTNSFWQDIHHERGRGADSRYHPFGSS